MKKEKKKYDVFSKMDIVGVFIYYILLIVFLIGIVYWGYFSGEISKLAEILSVTGGLSAIIYFLIFCVGLICLSSGFYNIAEWFYPDSKRQKAKKKKKRKEFRELLIEDYKKKIKKLEVKQK